MRPYGFFGLALLLLLIASMAQEGMDVTISLSISYDSGTLQITSAKLLSGAYSGSSGERGDYTAKLMDFKGNTLYSKKFFIQTTPLYEAPADWFDDRGNQIYLPNESIGLLNKTSFVLNMPYYRNVKTAEIYGPNGHLLAQRDLSEFAVCNLNGNCDLKEDFNNCQEDCISGSNDGFCDGVTDGACDPDCLITEDADCKLSTSASVSSSEGNLEGLLTLIVVAIIIASLLFYFVKRRSG